MGSVTGNMSLIGLTLALLIVVLCTSQGKIISCASRPRAPLANGVAAEPGLLLGYLPFVFFRRPKVQHLGLYLDVQPCKSVMQEDAAHS